ncbi:MAG TPA: methyltransferase domain-containing protein [Puia sp.]|nr:methyltransferase domain-containing protein [Puia sp.]
MSWDPAIYNRFKSERAKPFYDLLALIHNREYVDVIDLGCGTGELTKQLADEMLKARVLGIDSSVQMLNASSVFGNSRLRFEQKSIEAQIGSAAKWDLVFSNAALQWVENHSETFPKIISSLNPGGQLLVQIPSQHHNLTNKLLKRLSDRDSFRTLLPSGISNSPVLELEEYAALLFARGCKALTIFEKIYPVVVPGIRELFEWVSGTAIIPYLENLPQELHGQFNDEFEQLLQENFDVNPVFYPFKRIIISGIF